MQYTCIVAGLAHDKVVELTPDDLDTLLSSLNAANAVYH